MSHAVCDVKTACDVIATAWDFIAEACYAITTASDVITACDVITTAYDVIIACLVIATAFDVIATACDVITTPCDKKGCDVIAIALSLKQQRVTS